MDLSCRGFHTNTLLERRLLREIRMAGARDTRINLGRRWRVMEYDPRHCILYVNTNCKLDICTLSVPPSASAKGQIIVEIMPSKYEAPTNPASDVHHKIPSQTRQTTSNLTRSARSPTRRHAPVSNTREPPTPRLGATLTPPAYPMQQSHLRIPWRLFSPSIHPNQIDIILNAPSVDPTHDASPETHRILPERRF